MRDQGATIRYEVEHLDDQPGGGRLLACLPGVSIEVTLHPGHEQAALDALDAAVADVRTRIGGGR